MDYSTPIAQIAVSTIKGADKQDVYPKTVDKAVITTDSNDNPITLDKAIIKEIILNGNPSTIGEDNTVILEAPYIKSIETQESQEDGGENIVTITLTNDEETSFSVLNGSSGKTAYECYLETTTDVPVLSESEWIDSFMEKML